MSRIIFLDSGPLGIVTNPTLSRTTLNAASWVALQAKVGNRLIVPAVADFELRRELERRGAMRSLSSLNTFNAAEPDRYLPVTDSALKLAAKLWAQARNAGKLPADPKELNGDVLIAAQVLDYCASEGIATADAIIATVNVGHLNLFAPADVWSNILP